MPKFTVVSYNDTYKTPHVHHVKAKDADEAALELAKMYGDDDMGVVAVFEGYLQDQLCAEHVQWTTSLLDADED